jgi:hypothetical protein
MPPLESSKFYARSLNQFFISYFNALGNRRGFDATAGNLTLFEKQRVTKC